MSSHPVVGIASLRHLLERLGIHSDMAESLAKQFDSDRILEVLKSYVPSKYGPGGVIKALRENWSITPPLKAEDSHYPETHYQSRDYGYVYFMIAKEDRTKFDAGEKVPIKIGRTVNLDQRLRSFNSTEREYEFVIAYSTANYVREEMRLHGLAADQWIKYEWFMLDHDSIMDLGDKVQLDVR